MSLWMPLHCLEVNSLEVRSLIDIISSYPLGGVRKIHTYKIWIGAYLLVDNPFYEILGGTSVVYGLISEFARDWNFII